MPVYEYYCLRCEAKFELLLPMSRMDEPAACPEGHAGAERVLSTFAALGKGADGSVSAASSGGCAGCAGGACASCGSH